MLATISIIQLKETICKQNQLNLLSGGIKFNKNKTDFNVDLFSFSLCKNNIELNLNDRKDIGKYRKNCLMAFQYFLWKEENANVPDQKQYKLVAMIGSQDAYIKFLKLITINERLSEKFNECLENEKINPFLTDSSDDKGQKFKKMDLWEYDVTVYKQHNMNEFNKKAEECKRMGTYDEIEIDSQIFEKPDDLTYFYTKPKTDKSSGQPDPSKQQSAGKTSSGGGDGEESSFEDDFSSYEGEESI